MPGRKKTFNPGMDPTMPLDVDKKQRQMEEAGIERLKGRVVGKDAPDESKEHHTEIAVAEGHKTGKIGAKH